MNSSGSSLISRSEFRLVLQGIKIPMTAVDLEHLLARFNVRRKDGLVDFSEFLTKLKSTSRLSFMVKMLKKAQQRQTVETAVVSREGLSAMEAERQLFQLCQGAFIQLLEQFYKADIDGEGCVSQQDFKEIVERTIQTQLTPEQVNSFVTLIGDQESRRLSFMKFIALVQDRPSTSELKEEVERLSSFIKIHHNVDKIRYRKSFEMDLSRYHNAHTTRKLQELNLMVWSLLQYKFWQFCKVFINECRNDDCSADKEKLDSIFLRLNCVLLPEELETLWHSLPITYPIESITLQRFLSYFANKKRPKDCGPKRESPVERIQSQIAKDIIKYWKEIKSILRSRDPMGTGQISFKEICAIFMALKLKIGPLEFDTLCQAFDLHQDGNFHYIAFLRFYIKKNEVFQ